MLGFLREQCNHSYCEYVVIDSYPYVRTFNVELRYCKHCGRTYKSVN